MIAVISSAIVSALIPRYERAINDEWSFRRDCDSHCQTVSLPHTWNAEKGKAGSKIASSSAEPGKPITLEVPGAHFWSPDSPYLYPITIEAVKDGKVIKVDEAQLREVNLQVRKARTSK